MKKLMLLMCLCAGCAITKPTPIDTKPPLNLREAEPLELRKVHLHVITKEIADKKFKEIEDSGKRGVVIALSVQDYKNLAVNIQRLKAYIKTQQKIIRQYKNYYEGQTNDKAKDKKN